MIKLNKLLLSSFLAISLYNLPCYSKEKKINKITFEPINISENVKNEFANLDIGILDAVINSLNSHELFKFSGIEEIIYFSNKFKDKIKFANSVESNILISTSLDKKDDDFIINLEVIDVSNNKIIKEIKIYNKNLFDIQEKISIDIANILKIKLDNNTKNRIKQFTKPTNNIQAYKEYINARKILLEPSVKNYNIASELYNNAFKIDPNFKLAKFRNLESNTLKYLESFNYISAKKSVVVNNKGVLDLFPMKYKYNYSIQPKMFTLSENESSILEDNFKNIETLLKKDLKIEDAYNCFNIIKFLSRSGNTDEISKSVNEAEKISKNEYKSYFSALMYLNLLEVNNYGYHFSKELSEEFINAIKNLEPISNEVIKANTSYYPIYDFLGQQNLLLNNPKKAYLNFKIATILNKKYEPSIISLNKANKILENNSYITENINEDEFYSLFDNSNRANISIYDRAFLSTKETIPDNYESVLLERIKGTDKNDIQELVYTYITLAQIHYSKKLYSKAIEAYQKSIDLKPSDNDLSYIRLSEIYFEQNQREKAFEILNKLNIIHPESLENNLVLSNYFYSINNKELAIQSLKNSIPRYYLIDNNLTFDIDMDLLNNTIDKVFKDAVNNNSKDPEVYYYLATKYKNENRLDEANELFKKVYELDPNNAISLKNIAEFYYIRKNLDESLKYLEMSNKIEKYDLEVIFRLSDIYYRKGLYNQVIDLLSEFLYSDELKSSEFEKTMQMNINRSGIKDLIHQYLGASYYKLGDINKAKDLYFDSSMESDGYSTLDNYIGDFYYKQGKFKESLEAFKRSYEYNSKSDKLNHNLYLNYISLGNKKEALSYLKNIVFVDIQDLSSITELKAVNMMIENNFKDAKSLLYKSLKFEEQSSDIYNNIAICELIFGNEKNVKSLLDKSITLNSQNPVVHLNMGLYYDYINKKELAKNEYSQSCDLGLNQACNYIK